MYCIICIDWHLTHSDQDELAGSTTCYNRITQPPLRNSQNVGLLLLTALPKSFDSSSFHLSYLSM